jgi:hypothetical protein
MDANRRKARRPSFRDGELGRDRLDAARHAGNLPRDRILMRDALVGGALEHRLSGLESRLRRVLVAGRDRGLNRLDHMTHTSPASHITSSALRGLAYALTGRVGIGHGRTTSKIKKVEWR